MLDLPEDSPYYPLKIKQRKISAYDRGTQAGLATQGGPMVWDPLTLDLPPSDREGRQVTLSEGHRWPPYRGSVGDFGGPFYTERTYITDGVGRSPKNLSEFPFHYGASVDPVFGSRWAQRGTVLPDNTPDLRTYWERNPIGSDSASSTDRLETLGTTAIARCKPTNSVSELGTALGEIRNDGLPAAVGLSILNKRLSLIGKLGQEFLNWTFGWAPLISDVKEVSAAAAAQDRLWKQYKRDSGRIVRRRYEFPVERSKEIVFEQEGRPPSPAGVTYIYSNWQGHYTITRHVTRKVWFSGAFTYFLPSFEQGGVYSKTLENLEKGAYIYGLEADPELFWNLAPWSWAADWLINTGDVISNLSDMATDALVMHYGYVMEHVVVTDELRLQGCGYQSGTDISDLKLCIVHETKQRLKASPYGFGLTWDGFSPRQLSILAALAVTR